MNTILKIKMLAAFILLVLPFFLPFARLGNPLIALAVLWPSVWPVPLLIYEKFGRNELWIEISRIAGAVICLLAGYFLYAIDVFLSATGIADLFWHTWISIGAITLYFSASFLELAYSMSTIYRRLKI